LSTETRGSGDGGKLNINTQNLQLTNGGSLSSSTTQAVDPFTGLPSGPPPTGSAGTVTIQGLSGPAQSVLIDGSQSGIFTDTIGSGAGGNINIVSQTLQIQNGGVLSATTSGTASTATGGTITVNANAVNLSTGGTMTASSTGPGAAGNIIIQGLAS